MPECHRIIGEKAHSGTEVGKVFGLGVYGFLGSVLEVRP